MNSMAAARHDGRLNVGEVEPWEAAMRYLNL